MILLLGGTADSRRIAELLTEKGLDFCVSVTTDYGFELASEVSSDVVIEKFTENSLDRFMKENEIEVIVDATHPYATEISSLASRAAAKAGTGYFRFARKDSCFEKSNVYMADSYDDAVEYCRKNSNVILVTTGSRNIEKYSSLLKEKEMYFRVLPTVQSIEECNRRGINASAIIAVQGPFSREFNRCVIREKNIDTIITKESGNTGGFTEKISAAEEAGIKIVVIKKPVSENDTVFYETDELIKILEEEKA